MTNYPTVKMEIQAYADSVWPAMLDAGEVEKLTGVDQDSLLEYAKAGVCPHVLVNKKSIFFIKKHIIRWLKENVLDIREGVKLSPMPILVTDASLLNVPKALAHIADRLLDVPRLCGIYFLVRAGEIIYVGQSTNASSRITGHGDKDYDRVFLLPCPASQLDQVEAAFIGLFKPTLNMNEEKTRFYHNHKPSFDDPSAVLGEMLTTQKQFSNE